MKFFETNIKNPFAELLSYYLYTATYKNSEGLFDNFSAYEHYKPYKQRTTDQVCGVETSNRLRLRT